jgi:competence protein ComEA
MDAVAAGTPPAPPAAPPAAPAPLPSPVVTAWPRSAQLTTAFLLGVCATLLTVQAWSSLRWSSRPADLERGAVLTYRIDLNHAERAELLQLPGVGPVLVERIEEHRRQHGNFRSVDDLMQVQGIGPATLARVRPWVCVRVDEEEESEPADMTPRQPVKKPTSAMAGSSGARSPGKKESLNGTIDVNRASPDDTGLTIHFTAADLAAA